MTHFTFDTAYIVAHLQNNANERLKEDIVHRLTEDHWHDTSRARENFLRFEHRCWALEDQAYDFNEDDCVCETEHDAQEERLRRLLPGMFEQDDNGLCSADLFDDAALSDMADDAERRA